LVVVPPSGLVRTVEIATRLFLGNLDASPHVRRMRGASFVIERHEAGLVHTDGETHVMGPRLEIAVRPRSLRIAVPLECNAVRAPERVPGFALQLL
jgi:diacylglycerol kinase family enzyme